MRKQLKEIDFNRIRFAMTRRTRGTISESERQQIMQSNKLRKALAKAEEKEKNEKLKEITKAD